MPAMIIGIRGTEIAFEVSPSTTQLVVQVATATPTAGGATTDIGANETASATVGEAGVSVSQGLSSAAAGSMPGGGAGGGGAGSGGNDGDGADGGNGGSHN